MTWPAQLTALKDAIYNDAAGMGWRQSVTITKRTKGTRSAASGTPNFSTASVTATARDIRNFTAEEVAGGGGLILITDFHFFVKKSATLTALTTDDLAAWSGRAARIVNAEEKLVNGAIYEWEVQARA